MKRDAGFLCVCNRAGEREIAHRERTSYKVRIASRKTGSSERKKERVRREM